MRNDFYVCVVSCHKYASDKLRKEKSAEDLKRCADESAYFIDCIGHRGPIDSVSKSSIIILRYDARYVSYGEVQGFPDKSAGKNYVKIKELHWMNPNIIEKGVRGKNLLEHVIKGKKGDKVKEIDADYALEIMQAVNPDTDLYKRLTPNITK